MHAIIETFFNPIFPIFAVMLLGIVFARCSLFDVAAAQSINKFVFYVSVPALIFNLVCSVNLDHISWKMPLFYFLSEGLVFLTGTLIVRHLFRRSLPESILLGMAGCFVNHVFFILPIAKIIYGEMAVTPITTLVVLDTSVVFGGMITGLEIANHRKASIWKIGRQLLYNPVLMAIGLGFIVNIFDIDLHPGIHTYTSFVGSAAAPAALFSLGIILATTCKQLLDVDALTITALKIFLFPLLVWGLAYTLADFQPIIKDTLILTAAGPCGSMPFVLALQYKVRPESIGLAIIYSTVASLITLTLIA